MASTTTSNAEVADGSPIYDSYLPRSELEGEEIKLEMRAKHSSISDFSGISFLYTLGQLKVTSERVIFVSPRQVIDTELSAIQSIEHRKDHINRLMIFGGIGIVFGLLLGFASQAAGTILLFAALLSLAVGAIMRGEELVLDTAGNEFHYRTINTEQGLEAASAIRKQLSGSPR